MKMKIFLWLSTVAILGNTAAEKQFLPPYAPSSPGELCTLLRWAAARRDAYLVCLVERNVPGAWGKADACPANASGPLHLAAASGSGAVVRLLLALGADPEARDAEGRTPLHYAVNATRNVAVTFELLHAGASVNASSASGDTPLHASVRALSGAHALELLAAGASRGAANAAGDTPFTLATRTHDEFAGYLLGDFAVQTAYPQEHCGPGEGFAAQLGVTRVHESGLPRNQSDWCGRSPLFWYVGHMADFIPQELLSAPDVDTTDLTGRTALHEAARLGKKESVRALVAAGARVDAADWLGQTPLHLAELCQQTQAVAELRRAGASADIRDKQGRTPADLAQLVAAPRANTLDFARH